MQLALGVLERLYEKLVKERGRGHNAENALNGIFNLDSKKKGQDERRKAMKSGKKGKGGKGSKGPGKPPRGMKTVGAMDGNTFARAYCMAALARTPAELCQSLLPAIASVSRNGGDWQKKLQKSYSKQFSALGLSYSQLSLLRWVLEGFSFDSIKVKRALSALKKKGGEVLVELQHFIHAMNLLDVGLSDQVLESLYVAHGGEDGKINLDTLSKGLNIAAAQNENKNDVSMILSGVDEGENWMDSMKGGSAPAWAMKGMPRLAGSIENEEEAREMDIIINATSLGLKGGNSFKQEFTKTKANLVYYDVVYNPKETMMVKKFRKKNVQSFNGIEMFMYQGQKSFTLWNNINPELDEEIKQILASKIK